MLALVPLTIQHRKLDFPDYILITATAGGYAALIGLPSNSIPN